VTDFASRRTIRPGHFGARAGSALLIILAVLAALPGTSTSLRTEAVPPDLVADAPTGAMVELYRDSAGTRLLLRFNGYVHNRGTGAVELRGSKPESGTMTKVQQRIYDSKGGWEDIRHDPAPTILFEPTDSHNHWHLRNAARYSLWNEGRTAEVAPAMKVGFCLLDSQRIDDWAPTSAAYTYDGIAFCEQDNAGASDVVMGVSAGWRDVYGRSLAFQWVDISDVAPGQYWLRSEVDPDGVVAEADEANVPTFAASSSTVSGYLAKSFAKRIDPLLIVPEPITLLADKFGSPGAVQFRIDEAPKHGTLDKEVGEWFSGSTVNYTAPLGFTGQDSFRFSARSSTSDFPLNPRTATASLGVRTDPVATSEPETSQSVGTASDPRRAPDVEGPLPEPDGSALASPVVQVHHGDVLVRTVAWRAGIVRLTAADGSRSLGSCEVRAPAGQVVTCLLAEGVAWDLHDALAVATLHDSDRLIASRNGGLQSH
jgi:hypothetical protein